MYNILAGDNKLGTPTYLFEVLILNLVIRHNFGEVSIGEIEVTEKIHVIPSPGKSPQVRNENDQLCA